MANDITRAVNYLGDPLNLNGVYIAEAQLWFLMKDKFKVINANKIMLPKNTYGENEIPDYQRGLGYSKVAITRTWDDYTLTQDWGMELEMDEMDMEESISDGIVSFANDATRKLTVPRGDKYIGAKLLANAGNLAIPVVGDITSSNVMDAYDDALVWFQNKGVTGVKHLLVTPEVAKAIRNADGFSRRIDVKDERTGITRSIEYIDDVAVHIIEGKRLPASVNFFLVSEDSVFGTIKHNPSYFFSAGSYPGKDASVVDIRLYFDFFIFKNKKDGVYVHLNTADEVKVTFNLNDGEGFGGTNVTVVTPDDGNPEIEVYEGQATGLPTTPTATAHTFAGWFYDDGTFLRPYSGNRPMLEAVTVYAKWTKNV